MEFGLGLMNYPGCWDDVAFAEQHGFATAGFVESPVIAGDPFVCMGLTLQATSTIRVGNLINTPGLRDPISAASALSVLNTVGPGRVFFGVGTGYTSRLALGRKRQVPIATLGEYARTVRDLLEGREVMHELGASKRAVRMTNEGFLRTNRDHPIPVYVAADGPRALEMVGEVGDGLITTLRYASAWENAPEVFAASLATVKSAANSAGRSLEDPFTAWAPTMCVLEPGESAVSERALAMSGPLAMIPFHSYACDRQLAEQWPPAFRDRIDIYEQEVLSRFDVSPEHLYQEVHAGHLTHLLEGEASVLTEKIIRMTTLTGTADEIVAHLQAMEDAGLKNFTIWAPPNQVRDVIKDVAEKIMPRLTGSSQAPDRPAVAAQ